MRGHLDLHSGVHACCGKGNLGPHDACCMEHPTCPKCGAREPIVKRSRMRKWTWGCEMCRTVFRIQSTGLIKPAVLE